ncbi:MAG: segregation/condensation protein A [Methanocalculus sp. MSAO_Arc1]|uniref:segregation/condensation protein A n=1 Tax=Methanocalculus TaxID=71151 RepID=UPI000FF420B4|nr:MULTISPECIES: segregation/condensation protein A [unclassified Methanocalculus]MCP1663287.1 segregation and condensation protein A [Methanocalculus sp. AMF5]RQD79546.1 MAG: segregation/condensation protein A [Methanocalculus sp. MSAO_Arc1]
MAEEPVEILVRMAEDGEIDPWNIDIVLVTDRFLSELERRRELDLRISGRTLLYASILLRMKSDALLEQSAGDEDDADQGVDDADLFAPEDFESDGDAPLPGPIEALEREIQRRIRRKEYRTRPITLYELITQLKLAEKEERRRQRRRHLPYDDEDDLVIAEDVVEIAHEEAFDEISSRIYSTLLLLDPNGSDPVPLSRLASEINCPLYEVYIPVLFLMLEDQVDLLQEEFYGEIFVARIPASVI